MILTLVDGLLFVLLAIGTPVGFAMAGSGVLGLYLIGGMPMLRASCRPRRCRRSRPTN